MYKKKIGVIVPVYNIEKYLEECIESIINQTYYDLDIVLVDDGSSDSSGKICDEYKERDARIRVIHQKNKGLLNARYVGVKETNCEYVTFVDGDDWLDLDAYSIMAESLDGYIDMGVFGYIYYYNSENEKKYIDCIPAGKYFREQIEQYIIPNMIWNIGEKKHGMNPSLCTKIIKRNLLINNIKNVKDMAIYFGEDMAVTYPLLKEAKAIVISNKYLYYYRQREAGILSPYIRDEEFLSKLHKLYSYLKAQFIARRECVKQIDYFYSYAVRLRQRIYGDWCNNDRFLFPFWEIHKDSRIVLYGAGSVGQTYYDQLRRSRQYKVVAWVDRKFEEYQKMGIKDVQNIDVLKNIEYDFVVISVLSSQMSETIKKNLIVRGIAEDKIISVK